jgi:hypothetical protein
MDGETRFDILGNWDKYKRKDEWNFRLSVLKTI